MKRNIAKYVAKVMLLVMGVNLLLSMSKITINAQEAETSYTTPTTFSYAYPSKAKKVLKVYEKALENLDELIYLEADNAKNDSIYSYKQSLDDTEYRYYGDIKDGRPHGEGVIFENNVVSYVGNFDKGYPSGYGIKFYTYDDFAYHGYLVSHQVSYEGEWKKGKYEGKGVIYDGLYLDSGTQQEQNSNTETISDVTLDPVYISYEGNFKAGEKSGKGTAYTLIYGTSDVYVKYDGNYKNDMRNGQGTEYYECSTVVKYKGQFKNNEYNGKGSLYYEDGSLQYSGKFKNGEIK